MNKDEFKDQVKARGEELKQLEELVQNYAKQIKNVQGMLKGSMIMAFRSGCAATLDHLDGLAKQKRYERELLKAANNDFMRETSSGG